MITGTPQFMSPEQARGEAVDPRSDLFSLGSVLYAICTGRPPFRAETSYGVMRRITDDEPTSIRELNPDVPPWLCQIIGRLMSKRAADRYATADEVADLLEACLAHVQQPNAVSLPAELATQPSSHRFSSQSRRWSGVIAMSAAFALLGCFLWQATAPPDISGPWTSEAGGEVVIKEQNAGEYEGTSAEQGSPPGRIQLKWSRAERRFNGTWQQGDDLNGKLSLRLVGDEIRGAFTSSKKSAKESGTPRLADFVWTRSSEKKEIAAPSDENAGAQISASKRQLFEPVEGQPENTSWTVFAPPSLFSETDWVVMARMTIGGEARIQLTDDKQPRCVLKLLQGSDESITVQVQDAARKSKTIVSIARDQSAEVTVDGAGYNIRYPSVHVAPEDSDSSPFAQVILRRVDNKPRAPATGLAMTPGSEQPYAASVFPRRLHQYKTDEAVKLVACSPDGKFVAVAHDVSTLPSPNIDWKRAALILDIETLSVVKLQITTQAEYFQLAANKGTPRSKVEAIAFSPDGSLLAIGTSLGQVKLFNTRTGEEVAALDDEQARPAENEVLKKLTAVKRATGSVAALAFSPDGSLLAACGESFADVAHHWDRIELAELGRRSTGPGRLKVWDVKTGALRHDLAGHSQVFGVAFSPDGPWLASAGRWSTASSEGNGLLLWDLETGAVHRRVLIEANGGTHAVVFSPTRKLAATGSIIFDKENDARSASLGVAYPLSGITEWQQTIQGPAIPRGFSPEGRSLVVLSGRNSVRWLDARTGQSRYDLKADAGSIWTDLALASQSGILVIGGRSKEPGGSVEIWDVVEPDGEMSERSSIERKLTR